ncbi:MAG: hypothetical protein RLZZ490_132 [Cyanobacteriota bacterium]
MEPAMKVKNLDHLGIVAGLIDKIKTLELLNERLGTDPGEKVSIGIVVKAMLLNGLGFVSAPLYLFEQFFQGKETEQLLGKEIKADGSPDQRVIIKTYVEKQAKNRRRIFSKLRNP